MTGGFSTLEVIVAMGVSLGILGAVFNSVVTSGQQSRKILSNQEVLESIFHTVDTMKSDLTKCGMRLQEACGAFGLELFRVEPQAFKVVYGVGGGTLTEPASAGDTFIRVRGDDYLKGKRRIIIYNIEDHVHQFCATLGSTGDRVSLSEPLAGDFARDSVVVALKEVEYKLYEKQNCLKRKSGQGNFQPMVEHVTDFYLAYYPETCSLLYRLEVNHKEQIRGYIFLTNMVP